MKQPIERETQFSREPWVGSSTAVGVIRAGLTNSDRPDPIAGAHPPEDEDAKAQDQDGEEEIPPPPPPFSGKVRVMAGERELTTGLLSKDASFRLIVSGNIGVKEIERLIKSWRSTRKSWPIKRNLMRP